jgi:ATP-dependent Clp protease ATP-binding subunit ClpC
MIADRYQYHTTLETQISLVQASEKIELDALAPELLQTVAEEEVLSVEYHRDVFFTYAALAYIVESVVRYASERMHDTLKDYLDELALYARSHKVEHGIITLTLAQSFIGAKQGTEGTLVDTQTNTPRAPLQEVLSRRVKGQDAAIEAVARALDRVRAGLGSSKRPLGTFLFLGPTGVGKTETAKALAEAYFGNEEKMLRFDMSEFSDAGAMNRLIGSFEIGEVGILAGRARDVEHGVILFDEIEKAHEKVRDLMLQILDEGYFTDARGGKVNMKNFIMIATSNAGSDEIYKGSVSGNLPDKTVLIEHIIDQGIFRPEFVNRFDEVAVFNALGDRQLASIAEQKLVQYEARLYEKKAIHMNITPDLVAFIMNHIENKAFGGREITRTIQNYIESIIAKDLVDGSARAGTTVTLTYNNEEHRLISSYK